MKLRRLYPMALLLTSILACVIPGLDAPAPALAPVDTNMLSTAVVLTADAAVLQTAAVQSVATEIPAGTPVPRLTGTNIEQAQDGVTKYSDHDGNFEVVFPAGWLAVRPNNSDEFNASLVKDGAHNQMLSDQMIADMAEYNANVDRLYSYILRPDIKKDMMFGFSKLVWDSADKTSTIDTSTMGELVRGLEASSDIPGFHADTAQTRENGNAVTLIEVGGRFSLSDGQGGSVPLYTTIIFFKPTPTSLTRITFTYLQDYHDQISTDVKSIIDSIKVIAPLQ
ncbi:MAG: hypothetical protein HZB50_04800 [Chloroflexi bacterium]|nr:hypothetical protein [Chloroflexota bacterium]